MKPATPLPWHFDAERDNSASAEQMQNEPIGGSIMSGDFYLARIWSDCDSPVENGAYIAHAANAYPRLVEALRSMEKIARDAKGYSYARLHIKACDLAADRVADAVSNVLRELGEL